MAQPIVPGEGAIYPAGTEFRGECDPSEQIPASGTHGQKWSTSFTYSSVQRYSAQTGWIPVDRHTLQTRFPQVFAIGDAVSIPLKLGKPLPKAGVFAHGQAEVVARNIAAEVEGRAPSERFNGHGECFIEIGQGKAGFGGGDFYAEPRPEITLRPPSWRWHLGKVLFEKSWLHLKL